MTEKFLLYDNGPEEGERMLIFGRESWISLLCCEEWFVDGTFKISPLMFMQVFAINVKHFGRIFPVIYALLPNKRGTTYMEFFTRVKNLNPAIKPNCISCGYEVGIHNAVREVFEDVEMRG